MDMTKIKIVRFELSPSTPGSVGLDDIDLLSR